MQDSQERIEQMMVAIAIIVVGIISMMGGILLSDMQTNTNLNFIGILMIAVGIFLVFRLNDNRL